MYYLTSEANQNERDQTVAVGTSDYGRTLGPRRDVDTRDTGKLPRGKKTSVRHGPNDGVPSGGEESGTKDKEAGELSYLFRDSFARSHGAPDAGRPAGSVRRAISACDGTPDRSWEADA